MGTLSYAFAKHVFTTTNLPDNSDLNFEKYNLYINQVRNRPARSIALSEHEYLVRMCHWQAQY